TKNVAHALGTRYKALDYGLVLVLQGRLAAGELTGQLDAFVQEVRTVRPNRKARDKGFPGLDAWQRMTRGHVGFVAPREQPLTQPELGQWLGLLEATLGTLRQADLTTPSGVAQLIKDVSDRAGDHPAIQLRAAKLTFTTVTADHRPQFRAELAAAAAKVLLAVAGLLGTGGEVAWGDVQRVTDNWWLSDAVRTLTELVTPRPDGLAGWVPAVLDLLRMDLAVGGIRPDDQTPAGWLGARLDSLDSALDLVITGTLDAAEIDRR